MLDRILNNKFLFVTTIAVVTLLTLWPSFKLALTGDDYLGLWRFIYKLNEPNLHHNYISYWLTDYGPQDTTTAIIHKFFGFNSLPYYFISYLLRVLASISFFPLVKYITNNKKAALISSLFFAVTTTGLETTDWVFNMPSYLSITAMNIFFRFYFENIQNNKLSIQTLIIFPLIIIAQPIRTLFFPLVILFSEACVIISGKFTDLKTPIKRLSVLLIAFIILYRISDYGGSIGLRQKFSSQNTNIFNSSFGQTYLNFYKTIANDNFRYVFNPLGQMGAAILPNNIVPTRFYSLKSHNFVILITLPLAFLFYFFVKLFRLKYKLGSRYSHTITLFGLLWLFVVWYIFAETSNQKILTSRYLSLSFGGLAILLSHITYRVLDTRLKKLTLITSILLILISIIIPWFRNPDSLSSSWTRYFIIPAAGTTILLGVFYSMFSKSKTISTILCLYLMTQMYASFKYIYGLSQVRASSYTERIRNSIPDNPDFRNSNEILVYYFSTNNESVLHHSLLFGFPMFMHFNYGLDNPWRLVYTSDWNDVVSSYIDGESVKKFSGRKELVDLNNVYSFQLTNHQIHENTEEVRKQLDLTIEKP